MRENQKILALKSADVIKTKSAILSKKRAGIIEIDLVKDKHHTIDNMRELIMATMRLSRGEKIPILLKARNIGRIDKEALSLGKGIKACRITKAVGIELTTFRERFVTSLLLRYSRTPFPIRVFATENRALQWLEGFI